MEVMTESQPALPRLPEPYEALKWLGRGAFGSVVLAKERESERLVAIKRIPYMRIHSLYLRTEVLNHRKLQHPHGKCRRRRLAATAPKQTVGVFKLGEAVPKPGVWAVGGVT